MSSQPGAPHRRVLPRPASFAAVELVFLAIFFATSAFSPFLSFWQQEWRFPVWLLTFAFGIYALALLAALLTVGALSDHIGRRPVLIVSLLVCAASMIIVMIASDISWVIVGRVVQGFATGAATGAVSASIIEFVPAKHHSVGVLLAAVTPPAGQAIGGIVSSSALMLSSEPSFVVFGSLALVLVIGAVLIGISPETAARRGGALRSLLPRIGVPSGSRGAFLAAIPVLVSTWMTGAFYLGLVPAAAGIVHAHGGFITGLTLTLLNGVGVLATLSAQRSSPSIRAIMGEAILVVGVAGLAGSIAVGPAPLLIGATCVAGVGYGWAFSGAMGTVLAAAGADDRSGLFSALYIASYLALGIPAIVAGIVAGSMGVLVTALAYTAVVAIAASAGLVAQVRRRAGSRAQASVPPVGTPEQRDEDLIREGMS